MLRSLYQKSLRLAAHKSSKFFLAVVAFAESSFFPVPPDIMMVPMVIAKKNEYFKIFLIATISSALGGLLGYLIGSTFLDFAMNVIQIYGYEENVINLKNNLSSGEGLYIFLGALFLAGFTPLPFKVFTITSGIIGLNIILFFFICLISRGLRFFVVAYLVSKFDNVYNKLVEKKTITFFSIIGVIVFFIIAILYFVIK